MGKKKKKEEFYDTFFGYTWTVPEDSDLTETEMLSHIKSNWLLPADEALADFCKRGLPRQLAYRYAHGDKYLASRTQKARSEYLSLFNLDLLPKRQRRRVLDVVDQRIKDILPNLAARVAVEEVICSNPELDDKDVARYLYELIVEKKELHCQVPNAQFVKNIRAQMEKNGGHLPDFELDMGTKFQLSVTDQLASVKRIGYDRTKVELTINGGKGKTGKMIFQLPDKQRYMTGKVALPDIVRTSKNDSGVMFDFSISHKVPVPFEPTCSLGADVGVIYPVTSALVGEDWYSQAFYPPGWVLDQVDKLSDLAFQKSVIEVKIVQDAMPNRTMREGQKRTFEELVEMYTEQRDGIAAKMSDIKRDLAQWAAHSLCETAFFHKAQIVFEQLNWSDPSHAFFHAMVQERTRNLALATGIPVVMVSAKGTSSNCAHDGESLRQGKAEKPPAVKSGSKCRNSWRTVEKESGMRDAATRKRVAAEKGQDPSSSGNEFSVTFGEVLADHEARASQFNRSALCPSEGVVRDHDCVGARNIGVNGEVERGVLSRKHCLSGLEFRRVRRRDPNHHFGWAVSLSEPAAVSASAPVISPLGCNDAVGLVSGGSPPD